MKATNRIGLVTKPTVQPPAVKPASTPNRITASETPVVKRLPPPQFSTEDIDGVLYIVTKVPAKTEPKVTASGHYQYASLPGKWVPTGLDSPNGEIHANACFLAFKR